MGNFVSIWFSWPTAFVIQNLFLENICGLSPAILQNVMEALRSHGSMDTVKISTPSDLWSADFIAAIAAGLPHLRVNHFTLSQTRARFGRANYKQLLEKNFHLPGIFNNYKLRTARIGGFGTDPVFTSPLLATATSRNRLMALFKSLIEGILSTSLLPRALEKPSPDALFLALVEYPLLLPYDMCLELPFK